MTLGDRRGVRRVFPQNKLALDAQQLGHVPALLVSLGSRERLVDRCNSLGHVPDTGQAFRQSADKYRGREGQFTLTKLVESGAEKPQSGFCGDALYSLTVKQGSVFPFSG
jgi:hypothetical protein